MRCPRPQCRWTPAEVAKTSDLDGDVVTRRRRCPACAFEWVTVESPAKGSLVDIRSYKPPPGVIANPLLPLMGTGGVGGGLPSGSGSDPALPALSDPDPSLNREQEFVAFWSAYPLKVGKDAARRAWVKKRPPLAGVLAALEWQGRSPGWTKNGGEFIPHPATWLNAGRWMDEPPTPKNGFRFSTPEDLK